MISTATYVTNPLNCAVKWERSRRNKLEMPSSNATIYFPPPLGTSDNLVSNQHFIARSVKEGGPPFGCSSVMVELDGVNYKYRMHYATHTDYLKDQNPEIMYIDCAASLINVLQAELVDIQYNPEELMKGPVTLENHTIINNGPNELSLALKWRTNITKTVQMSMQSESTRDLAFHVSANFKVFGIGVETSFDGKWHNFVKNGYMNITTVEKVSEESNTMKVPPHSSVKASLETSPISGTSDFIAVYKVHPFNPDHIKYGLTVDRIKSMLIRAGFDKDKLSIKNNTVTLEYKGKMNVDSGHDTKFVVTTTNLTSGENYTQTYSAPIIVKEVV